MGQHQQDCLDRWIWPLLATTDGKGKILSVTTESGNVIRGQPADVFEFRCPDLALFATGRFLRRDKDRKVFWYRAPEEGGEAPRIPPIPDYPTPNRPSVPIACSTPLRNEPAAAAADITIGNSMVNAQSFSQMLANSQRQSSMSTQLLSNIPEFDGQARNFDPWKQKVQLAADTCSVPEEVLPFVRMRLRGKAAQFAGGLGIKASTLNGLLKALQKEFDDLNSSMAVEVALRDLKQGTLDITTHHGEVTRILRAMCETTQTQNPSIHTSYISSLSDNGLRLKLLSKKMSDVNLTLEDMMTMASNSARVKDLDRIATRGSTTRTVAAAQFDEFNVNAVTQQGPPHKRPRLDNSPRSDKWCEIHRSKTHDTRECRSNELNHCPWCKTPIPVGSLLRHKSSCQAPKCNTCDRFGHLARNCKKGQNSSSFTNQRRGGYQQQRQNRQPARTYPAPQAQSAQPNPAPNTSQTRPQVHVQAAQVSEVEATAVKTEVETSTASTSTD